jgi:hypothetical protein
LVYSAGQTVTISGDNLLNTAVTINNYPITLITNTINSLSFLYPALPAGNYEICINTTSAGLTHPVIMSTTKLSIGSLSSTSGSTGGNEIIVYGNGFVTNVG